MAEWDSRGVQHPQLTRTHTVVMFINMISCLGALKSASGRGGALNRTRSGTVPPRLAHTFSWSFLSRSSRGLDSNELNNDHSEYGMSLRVLSAHTGASYEADPNLIGS